MLPGRNLVSSISPHPKNTRAIRPDPCIFRSVSYLEIRNLHTHFTQRTGSIFSPGKHVVRAVDGVSLSIEKGEILGLVGESGCGKSTLSRTIMQLVRSTSGSIILNGEDLSKLTGSEVRRRRLDFQMVFQDPYASLNPRMTVGEIVGEPLAIHRMARGAEREARVAEMLARGETFYPQGKKR